MNPPKISELPISFPISFLALNRPWLEFRHLLKGLDAPSFLCMAVAGLFQVQRDAVDHDGRDAKRAKPLATLRE